MAECNSFQIVGNTIMINDYLYCVNMLSVKKEKVTSSVLKICPNVAGGMIALRLWQLFFTNENLTCVHFKNLFEYFLYNRCTICRLKKTETLGTKNEYFLWFKPYPHTIYVVVSLLSMLFIIELNRLFNTM